MARILPDRDVKKLLSCCVIGGLESQLNPDGIELRLGKHIRSLSTGEEREIPDGHFVKIAPGENVIISSLEKIDFSKEATAKVFPGNMVMAFITPTTTMMRMREGITQSATKFDPGFVGQLNWGLRNSSIKDLILQNGESIFKLTFWLLTFLLVALFFPVGLIPYCPPVGYIFYLGHLILTCSVQTRKWFRILIIILVVAIIINLAGCAEMNRQLSHFSP